MVEEEHIDATTNGTEEPEDDDKKVKKSNRHDGGVADLERVTDYAEEKELSSADITNVNITSNRPLSWGLHVHSNYFPRLL